MSERARVGVSSCLLGHRVRYDGAEKSLSWVTDTLANLVELIPVCPEVGAGMSVPRPPIQMVERDSVVRIELVHGTGEVHQALEHYCQSALRVLEQHGLHGYLFKARSPSCGVVDTPHFAADGDIVRRGSGLWAQAVLDRWPTLPVADESQVQDEEGREAFLQRVHDYWRRSVRR